MIRRVINALTKERDLTKGSISKNLLVLAVPILTANIFDMLFNIVDMFWVGRLGPAALASVAMSGTILMVVMFMIAGIAIGTTALVSRAIGAKDQKLASQVVLQSILFAVLCALICGAIGFYFSEGMLRFLGATPEVIAIGGSYLKISFAGLAIMFLLYLSTAVLQGAGDAFTPMLILATATVINIVLDPLMIFGIGFPKMGVAGAIVATLVSEAIAIILAAEVLLRGRSRLHIKFEGFKIDWEIIKRILRIGIPGSMQMTLRGVMNLVLMAVVANFGMFAVAAFGVGVRLHMIAMVPGFAFGMAAATLVGQNLGAKNSTRAEQSAWTATLYYLTFMTMLAIIYVIFAPVFISVFNTDPSVIAIGSAYLRIVSFSYIFIAFGVVLGRALGGAGDTVAPLAITFISLWLLQVPLAIVLSKVPTFGVIGVWYAIVIAAVANGIMTLFWFNLGKWKHKRV